MMVGYQAQLNQVGWILASIAIITVALRCYCRLVVLKRFGWDDGFMVFALLSGVTCAALVTTGVHYGYGMHLDDITNDYDREQALKYTFIAPAPSIVSSTAGKISMVFFLLRLLGTSAERWQKWFLFSVTFIMIGLNIFAIGFILGNCQPVEKSWKPMLPGKCLPAGFLNYGGRLQAIWNAFMDLVTAGFPVYMVWRLQVKRSTKWGLTALMGGGVFAAAATLVKVYYMRNITKLTDVTWAWSPLSIWYMSEIFVLIITGSIPTLKPVWSKIRGRMPSSDSYPVDSNKKHPSGHDGSSCAGGASGPSKNSHGFKTPRPGSITIALREIDDITHREAGSSTESILPRQPHAKEQDTASERSADPIKDNPPQHHALSTPETTAPSQSIQVKQDFSVSYDQREGTSPIVKEHYYFP